MAGRFEDPKFRGFVKGTNIPLAGGKLYVYENGTVTPTNSYTNRGAGTPNTNPVILDAYGEADVWLPAGAQYTLKLDNSADVQQYSKDGVSSNDLATFLYNGSNIYFDTGSVTVGSTTVSATFTVTGTAAISSTLTVTGVLTGTTGAFTTKVITKQIDAIDDTTQNIWYGGTHAINPTVTLYGFSHATLPGRLELGQYGNSRLAWDYNGDCYQDIPDNRSAGLTIRELTSGLNYIKISTQNTLESISFGNATTNQVFNFLGKGPVLFPVLTTAERDAISVPVEGQVIYNTTTNVLNFYNGAVWGAV
jgi:hypothetical protein